MNMGCCSPKPRPGEADRLLADRHLAEKQRTRDMAFLQRCVKRTLNPVGEWLSPSGARWDVEQVPFCSFGSLSKQLHEYGCSFACTLLLRLSLECACALLLMLLVNLPMALDNFDRNSQRNECRVNSAEDRDAFVQPDAFFARGSKFSGGELSEAKVTECGYSGVPLRAAISSIEWYMKFALGSCQEYNNYTEVTIPSPTYTGIDPFTDVPNAHFCSDPSSGQWRAWLAELGSPLLWLAFLLRLRQLARCKAIVHDQALLSASDYAIHLDFRYDGQPQADDASLAERLRAELAVCGFPPSSIAQMEVAQTCAAVAARLRKLAALQASATELKARHLAISQARAVGIVGMGEGRWDRWDGGGPIDYRSEEEGGALPNGGSPWHAYCT